MLEWITILFALFLEATSVTWPARDLPNRIPFLKWRSVWALPLIVLMFLLSISYLVFSFVWALSEVPSIRVCGMTLLLVSFLEMFWMTRVGAKNPFLRRLDGALCFVCLTLIAYTKTKGW